MRNCTLHVSTFSGSSSGELGEKQTKFLNCLNMDPHFTVCSYYCDMTPERWKCAVREAPQRRSLLDNGSLGTFQQQRIGLYTWSRITPAWRRGRIPPP
jgi:hypothetical protein